MSKLKYQLLHVLIGSLVLIHCTSSDKQEPQSADLTRRFINPPIKNVDVPWHEYAIEAGKGDTIFYPTGSILLFPADAFVDKNGNIVAGSVQLKYREFADPMDFYLSGIPMDYDSSGTRYTFESSAMCEVRAFKNGEALFVNPKSVSEIFLASENDSPEHNLYYLDTVQGKWLYKGPGMITDLSKQKIIEPISAKPALDTAEIVKPVKPEKVAGKNPVIQVVIDPASFRELMVYDNLLFQLEGDLRGFNPNDSKEEWSNIQLERVGTDGLYKIKFSNQRKVVSYPVRPVLAGKDYDAALKIFEEKDREYRRQHDKRIANEDAKNRWIKQQELIRDSMVNQAIEANNIRAKKLKLLLEARDRESKRQVEAIKSMIRVNKIYRGFNLTEFGAHNYDRPIILMVPKSYTFQVDFIDTQGEKLALENIAVIYRSTKILYRLSGNYINVAANGGNIVCGMYNDQFAYISYKDYSALHIDANTKAQIFTMTLVPVNEINYDSIKNIAN